MYLDQIFAYLNKKHTLSTPEIIIAKCQDSIRKAGFQWVEFIYNDGLSHNCSISFTFEKDPTYFIKKPLGDFGFGRYRRISAWLLAFEFIHKNKMKLLEPCTICMNEDVEFDVELSSCICKSCLEKINKGYIAVIAANPLLSEINADDESSEYGPTRTGEVLWIHEDEWNKVTTQEIPKYRSLFVDVDFIPMMIDKMKKIKNSKNDTRTK